MSKEGPVKMAVQEDNAVRMAGYLDKRNKMKLVSTWKRYWFVLKHHLLLYYKSQLECLNLSVCRGSLNMGLASCVRPGPHRGPPATATQGYTIEVVTRTQVVVLRTKDRGLQEQWLKALLESMALPNISTPIRTSGGPLHFRYSMDNLPVDEEPETEEKQKTLPHPSTLTRNDSALGYVKRMGGYSYGGSLDTILKLQPGNQVQTQRSPQQPKIPRIKAVDRMLGFQYLNNHENNAALTNENQNTDMTNEKQCLCDCTYSCSNDEVSNRSGEDELKYNDVSLHRLMDTSSDSYEKREDDFKYQNNQEAKLLDVAIEDNQDHEKFNFRSTEEARKYNINFLESQRYLSSLENGGHITVENKLYETTKEVEYKDDKHEVENKLYEKTEEINNENNRYKVENKFYEKVEHGEEGKQYDSGEEISSFTQVCSVPEDEKMYAIVSVCTDGVKEVQGNEGGSEYNGEYDYYCSYARVSPTHLLPDQLNRATLEPDLPPRPLVGSSDSSKNQFTQQAYKAEDEEAEYSEYYESTDSCNARISPSQLLSLGGEGSSSEKKRSTLHVIKLKKKKSQNKESVTSENGSSIGKKKHRMSFLHRMLKHYRKRLQSNSESVVIADDREDNEDPEYETVDYSAPMLKHEGTEKLLDTLPRHNNAEDPDKEICKEKLFVRKTLLRKETMLELEMKLKSRVDAVETAPTAPASEDNEGYECISSEELPDRKPIPSPMSCKQNLNQDKKGPVVEFSRYRCSDGINRANKPPSLPPHKVARPCSPWHDVPKNNSPVYGNFQNIAATAVEKEDVVRKETLDTTIEKQSVSQCGELDQNVRDELLGTPRGFVYIQNKWKAAEKLGEWCHEQQSNKEKPLSENSTQKETFPENCRNAEEIKVMGMGSSSSDSVKSDTVSHEHKTGTVLVTDTCRSDIYSVVHKDNLTAKNVTQSFNLHTEKVEDKPNFLYNIDDMKACKELNCVNDKTRQVQVNNVEMKFNGNVELYIESTSTKREHDGTSDYKILNYRNDNHNNLNIDTTNYKDPSDDVTVTLRKSETDSASNKHEVLLSDTKNCRVVVSGENDNHSSIHFCSERDSKEVEEELKDKAYNIKNSSISSEFCNMSTNYSSQQEMKTLFNNVYNKNILTSRIPKDLSHRVADNAGTMEHEDVIPHLNRHSDELNLLLAQLAEITSAPLLPQGATSSLVDIPDGKKPKPQADDSSQLVTIQPELFVLGPIRRRRHSDPDYDVPRPHASLLHLLLPNRMSSRSSDNSHSGQESDIIGATRFFGEIDLSSNSECSSLSLRHSAISEVDSQSDMSYYVSMAPDSLEVPLTKDMEGSM